MFEPVLLTFSRFSAVFRGHLYAVICFCPKHAALFDILFCFITRSCWSLARGSALQPQAVNADFDVFSGNRRDVLVLNWSSKGESGPSVPVAFVAIGAMLVGSIAWTNANQGASVQRGDEAGSLAGIPGPYGRFHGGNLAVLDPGFRLSSGRYPLCFLIRNKISSRQP